MGTNVLSYIPGSPTRGKAWGMDPSGDIVGNEKVSTGQEAYFLAYGSTSGVTLPQVNPSDAYAIAYAVKDSSTVVGTEGVASSSAYGVIWTKTGSTWAAAALPGLGGTVLGVYPYPGAYAISSNGIITGSSVNTAGFQDAVTWTNSGSGWVVNDLITHVVTGDNVQNATGMATALAVNSSGVVVGNDNLANFPSISWYACVFQGGNAVTLGSFATTHNHMDSATGINDSGVVVGYADYGGTGTHAFIWDSVHGFRDMNTVYGPRVLIASPRVGPYILPPALTTTGTLPATAATDTGSLRRVRHPRLVARRRQRRRQGGHQRLDDRADGLQQDRRDELVHRRLQRRRQSRHQ